MFSQMKMEVSAHHWLVVNTRTSELLKDLNLMQENRMISEMSYLFLTILQPFWKYI